ncbi:trem-like transcript 2 protein isoform X2 [Castor canadensis]|nr:trem-like transcript 2 protein isoform X3 [Castor canadensis]
MEPLFLLLLLLWLQNCISGSSVESVYKKVQHREGDTMSVQCSYKFRRNRVEGKAWCKVRKRKCDPGFARGWVNGPRYLLQDDTQAKVVRITMETLKRQDSGRYWCMRNTSGILYPLMGFLLEVSPAPTTERNDPLTRSANILKNGIVTMGQEPTSGPDAPFTSGMTVFTSGFLTLTRLLSPAASGTTRPTSVTGNSFMGTSATTAGHRRTTGPQSVTVSSSNTRASTADPVSTSSKSRHVNSNIPTIGTCHNQLPSLRSQEPYLTVLVVVLIFLPVPVMLVVLYRFWKKRHMGSYNLSSNSMRPWKHPPGAQESPWKPAWFEIT